MCGPGKQTQKRVCKLADNDHDKCKKRNTIRRISCHEAGNPLPDCPKVLGKWKNVGPCNSEKGRSVPCGPGYQSMSRDCLNGTGNNMCLETDVKRVVTCLEAGTKLPDCPKKLGEWKSIGTCTPVSPSSNCGPGIQKMERTCEDGTGREKCSEAD